MLFERENPIEISTKLTKDEVEHKMFLNIELLNSLKQGTETILFYDLMKTMLKNNPLDRGTCSDLLVHALFAGSLSR